MRTVTHPQQRATFTHSAQLTPEQATPPPTVSEALRSEISAFVRSGAVDACECCTLAMEAVAKRFGLTFRQCEQLFTELA